MKKSRILKRVVLKDRDVGSKGGDRQPNQEGGRAGSGTRPAGNPTPATMPDVRKGGGQSGGPSGGKGKGR